MKQLTKREEEVADLISQGYNQREISEILYISTHTTSDHLTHIYNKLELEDGNKKTKLAVWWRKNKDERDN